MSVVFPSSMTSLLTVVVALTFVPAIAAFGPPTSPTTSRPAPVHLSGTLIRTRARCVALMVPRYDESTQRWSPSSPEEEASEGYSPFGSLIRQGPVPFVRRLVDPDSYDQGVLKMMTTENGGTGMSRDEAQGNMDAYLQNPNDWALQKLEEKRTGIKYDYANANMDVFSLVLTAAWTGVLLSVLARVLYVYQNGCDEFCQTYHW